MQLFYTKKQTNPTRKVVMVSIAVCSCCAVLIDSSAMAIMTVMAVASSGSGSAVEFRISMESEPNFHGIRNSDQF